MKEVSIFCNGVKKVQFNDLKNANLFQRRLQQQIKRLLFKLSSNLTNKF